MQHKLEKIALKLLSWLYCIYLSTTVESPFNYLIIPVTSATLSSPSFIPTAWNSNVAKNWQSKHFGASVLYPQNLPDFKKIVKFGSQWHPSSDSPLQWPDCRPYLILWRIHVTVGTYISHTYDSCVTMNLQIQLLLKIFGEMKRKIGSLWLKIGPN